MSTLEEKIKINFEKLGFDEKSINTALNHLKLWLLHPEFALYKEQIEYLIESNNFNELFDSFYQVIPFGTSGRRGIVGIGYNRINQWTIAATAQGHAQYLHKKFKDNGKERGIVIAYDVRQYTNQKIYSNYITNPIWGITSKQFAEIAATVYSINGFKVYMFEDVRSTPQLSFTIRELETVSGINITASHNKPDYNGIKIFDASGGQLIPPFDQELMDEINNNVNIYDVKWNNFEAELKKTNIQIITEKIEDRYPTAVKKISLSKNRDATIVFSPLHGTGRTSVFKVLKSMNFDVHLENEGSFPSGEFESVPNHTADPTNLNVYWNSMNYADEIGADIIITTDPDADKIGIMVNNSKGKWMLLDGNQICTLLTYFTLEKYKRLKRFDENSVILATLTVTKLIAELAKEYGVKIKDTIIPGFKFIADEISKLDKKGNIDSLLIAMEDSNGHLAGNYAREKDACVASVLLSEFAGEMKSKNLKLLDALEAIYKKFGFYATTSTHINFEYSFEKEKIERIFKALRKDKENSFEKYKIINFKDYLEEGLIKSETDREVRNILEFHFERIDEFEFFRVILRPSGTEPKLKIYIEIGTKDNLHELDMLQKKGDLILKDLSEYFINYLKALMQ
ncbi:phospho-sugar mutase [Candidatus Dojkabacteria bacterium]|nr:phospho-sugar mutase [Candidatus Dojkabacteria bacterium]